MTVVAALMAAGQSRRFGAADKLGARIGTQALLSLSSGALNSVQAEHYVAILRDPSVTRHLPPGFETRICTGTMSDSLRAAVVFAQEKDATKLLVCLGDMPSVRASTLASLVLACDDNQASTVLCHGRRMVPACFPASWFGRLSALAGDTGARDLLRTAPDLRDLGCDPTEVVDIDYPDDLHLLISRKSNPA